VALELTEDGDVPNALPLEKVVQQAARVAARKNPEAPLNQVQNGRLLWELFEELSASGVGRALKGRRGHRTRFEFNPNITCKDVRLAFEELGIHQRRQDGTGVPRPEDLTSASPALQNPETDQSLDRAAVIALLKKHEQKLHELGVRTLSLFGSVVRNEARPDSDVDLLATFDEPITSDAFFAAKFFLEDLLGRRVDLLTESALRDRVRRVIEAELVRVA
jgi:predicted nucleotidyltransferase